MLLYIFCFGCLMGFIIHFHIIFGTNLLTQGRVQIVVFFCLFQCFAQKEYQTESKWNETFGRVIFGTISTQKTWSTCQEASEVSMRAGARPHPRGPLVAPLTCLFLLYIPTYPETIWEYHETLIPPPQPSVPVRSHLGAYSGAPSEGGSSME